MRRLTPPLAALALLIACDDDPQATSRPDAAPETIPDARDELDAALLEDAAPDVLEPDAAPDAQAPDAARPDPTGRPEGWTEETHGKDAEPDYATVFPTDRVNIIHLRCGAETWQAMLDDLADLTGRPVDDPPERPSGPSGGPDEWMIACEGLDAGDACEVPEGAGECVDDPGGLICIPEGGFGLPPELFEACEARAEGEACEGLGEEGVCLQDMGGLACIPLSWLEGPGPGGEEELLYAVAPFWSRKPAWFGCDVVFEGRTWRHVGVRFKGNSTLEFSASQTLKLPLKLDFDELEDDHPEIDDQRFFGFKHLSTVNQIMDPSFLRQRLAADLFRAMGVPAPRTASYAFYLDLDEGAPRYMGLYTVTEVPHKPLLAAQLGGDEGTLYKCDGLGAQFAEFHPESFHQKTNKGEEGYAMIEAFIQALNAPAADPAAWRAALEATFDVEGFLRFLALNQAMTNWDTYGALAHNYYLYSDPNHGGRLTWIPWDFDLSLEGDSDLSLMGFGPEWPLLQRVAQDPVYSARYRALLEEAATGPFKRAAVLEEIRRLSALIEPYVVGPEGEQPRFTSLPDEGAFAAGLEQLRRHVEGRHEVVSAFLSE